jgi:hypothetical protein
MRLKAVSEALTVATMADAVERNVISCIVAELDRYVVGRSLKLGSISIEGVTAEHLKE